MPTGSRSLLILAASIGTAAISLAMAIVLLAPSLSGQAVAQQNDTTTTTQSIMPASSNKTFYMFSEEVEVTNAVIAGDIFTLPVIVANQGDSITVHLFNTEEEEENHSFTIDAQPYSVDIDVAAGQSGNATFTADQEGIYPYYCKYHLPTMTGQLVVLPPASSDMQ